MNFNEWWYNTGSGMRPQKNEDTEEFASRIAATAWHTAVKKERERCVEAVQSIAESGDDSSIGPMIEFMSKSTRTFHAGVTTIVQLTKTSAVEAIDGNRVETEH